MKKPVTTYIALGSNKGNRLSNLQEAVHLLFERLGDIQKISKVYKTPAWGFEGPDFLNACVQLQTRYSATRVLEILLAIETKLGRQRNGNGYESRTLDLDLLFYGDQIMETQTLSLPHPRLHLRKFVLQPLADIAGSHVHPVLEKRIDQLLIELQDDSPIEEISKKLDLPKSNFPALAYLAIEGNIGSGKTSLATMISQDFKAKLITERFKDNPFLPKFYENRARYAFPLEMSFLADRYQQLLDDIGQFDLFNDFVVADYYIYKSMIFADVTLGPEEYNLYKKLFQIMYKDLPKPDLYVYLYQHTERLLKNIKKRGRSYEQEIPSEYLDKINKGYLGFIKNQNHLTTKIIDITELDFVERRQDYLTVLREINSLSSL